jgi:hypothetical protein
VVGFPVFGFRFGFTVNHFGLVLASRGRESAGVGVRRVRVGLPAGSIAGISIAMWGVADGYPVRAKLRSCDGESTGVVVSGWISVFGLVAGRGFEGVVQGRLGGVSPSDIV